MTEKVNEWGQTYREWCDSTHADLVNWTGYGLGDIQDDYDLGTAWMDGWGAGDLARELGLLPPDELREAFGDD